MSALNIGDTAPEFELQNQQGQPVKLSDFRNKKHLVLYFYPKDETPGCTREACGFRDLYEDFIDAGAEVVGVSADSVNSHERFTQNHNLPFVLLSDPKNVVRKAYGVSGSLFGLLPGRETFVIDKEGIIQFRFSSQFEIGTHIRDALEVIEGLE